MLGGWGGGEGGDQNDPRRGLFLKIAKCSRGSARRDTRLHCGFAGQATCLFRFNRRCAPDHAPTSLRTTPAFKESLEVTPVIMRDLSKHHVVGNVSPISHAHWRWLPFPEFDKGKQERVDREKAQVNRSLEGLYFLPISTGSSRSEEWVSYVPDSGTYMAHWVPSSP